jgi:hypothetical protein
MALYCYTHQINYGGSECPRCVDARQLKEVLESDRKTRETIQREQERTRETLQREQERTREANERGLRATAKALGEIVEYQEEKNTQFQNIMSALSHTIDKVTDKVVFLEDKFDRYVKEEMMTTEEVFTFGKAGGPLGQGKDCIENCQLLPNGQVNLEHINHFVSPRLRPSFEEGIKQYKEQFKGPGLAYIQSQIEACASKGFIQNKELGEQPKWEYANGNITIYYYQENKVFHLDLYIRNQNNIGHLPFQPPLESKCLDLATFEVEDEAHPLYALSLLDGTVSLNEGVVALICKDLAADFEHPIRRGFELYVHSLNDETRKQQRFLAIQNLQEKLQKEWDELERKRLEELERKRREAEAELERKRREAEAELERKRKEAEAELERKRREAEIRRITIIGVIVILIFVSFLYFTSYGYRISKYAYVSPFYEGLAKVFHSDKDKWGFIDETGKEVVPPKYDVVGDFSEGFAIVELNGKYGFVDMKGKEVVPLKYDNVGDFSEGFAGVRLGDKRGKVDKNGKEYWDMTRDYSTTGETISTTGETIIPPKYDYVGRVFFDGLAWIRLGDKWGFINEQGKVVVPPVYDEVRVFDFGFAQVKLNGKWGVVDQQGKVVIPPKYDYASNLFPNGLALVGLGGKLGFVDQQGNEVIPLKYDYCDFFSDDLTQVKLGDKKGFVDKQGNEYWSMTKEQAREQMKKR